MISTFFSAITASGAVIACDPPTTTGMLESYSFAALTNAIPISKVRATADNPIIVEPLSYTSGSTSGTFSSSVEFTQSTSSIITVEAWDQDLAIPSAQSSFYSENLTLNLSITGPNTALFSFTKSANPSSNKSRFVASFTPATVGNYNITINISDAVNLSDKITFNLSVVATASTASASSSSGGGGSTDIPVSLKIIMPGSISSKKRDKIILPIQIYNNGKTALNNIILSTTIAKNGILRKDILSTLDKSTFSSLAIGERKNLTLIVDVNTEEMGLYEITINATVKSPAYTDWAKVYLTVEEGEKVEEKLIFTEEYIVGNPECAELKELVDEARALFEKGDMEGARQKLNQALDACKEAISLSPITGRAIFGLEENVISYTAIGSLVAAFLGFAYYQYRRVKLKRALIRGY